MTYDYAHLICFSPTHSSHMIGETVLQGLGTGHVSETDLTYEKPEENLTIHSGITVIVVPVYGDVSQKQLWSGWKAFTDRITCRCGGRLW
ncbi:MAG: hypothetical protein ACLTZU_07945 [Odoribacter splanchnicus]